MLRAMIDDVLREHPVPDLRAESLAMHIQAVLQGAFIMAKARQDVQAARDSHRSPAPVCRIAVLPIDQ